MNTSRLTSLRIIRLTVIYTRLNSIVALRICEWQGQLLDVELATLRRKLNRLRDYLFKAAG